MIIIAEGRSQAAYLRMHACMHAHPHSLLWSRLACKVPEKKKKRKLYEKGSTLYFSLSLSPTFPVNSLLFLSFPLPEIVIIAREREKRRGKGKDKESEREITEEPHLNKTQEERTNDWGWKVSSTFFLSLFPY